MKGQYSHILIDCQPSLGMLTVNALAAANRIIVPVQAEYLPAKGLEQLLSTINKVKRQLNPKLQIDGILLTMVDNRTQLCQGDRRSAARNLWQQNQGVWHRDSPFGPGKGNKRRGQEHFRP